MGGVGVVGLGEVGCVLGLGGGMDGVWVGGRGVLGGGMGVRVCGFVARGRGETWGGGRAMARGGPEGGGGVRGPGPWWRDRAEGGAGGVVGGRVIGGARAKTQG